MYFVPLSYHVYVKRDSNLKAFVAIRFAVHFSSGKIEEREIEGTDRDKGGQMLSSISIYMIYSLGRTHPTWTKWYLK